MKMSPFFSAPFSWGTQMLRGALMQEVICRLLQG